MTNLLTARPMIIDFETSGKDPEKDRAIEVAAIVLDGDKCHQYSSLINPGIPISPEASAIHHLIDSDVADARPWSAVKADLLSQQFDLFVAHYADFDMKFFAHDGGPVEGKPVLCTWRMAKKLVADVPSYSNMALHYRLGLPGRPTESHRATADAVVTSGLYKHLLALAVAKAKDPTYIDMDQFISWINSPMMETTVKFGKHFGKTWVDVVKTDRSYVEWVLNKSDVAANNPDVKFTIETLLKKGA